MDKACIGNLRSVKVEFREAGQLAEFGQAGIRDCGVSVGKVETFQPD